MINKLNLKNKLKDLKTNLTLLIFFKFLIIFFVKTKAQKI